MTNESPHRQVGDATLGSAPLVSPASNARSAATAFCGLDLTSYLDDLGDDIPERQALEFLGIVASMMATCVRLGFDLGVFDQVLDAFNKASTATPAELESEIQTATKADTDLQDGGKDE